MAKDINGNPARDVRHDVWLTALQMFGTQPGPYNNGTIVTPAQQAVRHCNDVVDAFDQKFGTKPGGA